MADVHVWLLGQLSESGGKRVHITTKTYSQQRAQANTLQSVELGGKRVSVSQKATRSQQRHSAYTQRSSLHFL